MTFARTLLSEQPIALGALLPAEEKPDGFTIQGTYAASTKGADKNRTALIIGGGDVYQKLMRDVFNHRETTRWIFDTNEKVGKVLDGKQEHFITSLNAIPTKTGGKPDIDYVMVLTPGGSHLEHIKWAFEHDLPVVVEKPVVVNEKDAKELAALLEHPHPPLYCIDWAIEHAKPLLHALGAPVSFADTLVTSGAKNPQFDLDHIVSIRARWLHKMSTSEESAYQRRKWVDDLTQGAGQLYDNGVHLLNPLAVAGLVFSETEKPVAHLGKKTDRKGEYDRITGNEAEEYVRIEGNMHWRADTGHHTPEGGIRTSFEVGWNALKDEYIMELTDNKRNILRWQMYPNRVEYLGENKKPQQETVLKDSDCYDRVLEHATQFVTDPNHRNEALYAPEQLGVIRSVASMQQAARTQTATTDVIYTGQLRESIPSSPGRAANSR